MKISRWSASFLSRFLVRTSGGSREDTPRVYPGSHTSYSGKKKLPNMVTILTAIVWVALKLRCREIGLYFEELILKLAV